jgi:hypothetical protein
MSTYRPQSSTTGPYSNPLQSAPRSFMSILWASLISLLVFFLSIALIIWGLWYFFRIRNGWGISIVPFVSRRPGVPQQVLQRRNSNASESESEAGSVSSVSCITVPPAQVIRHQCMHCRRSYPCRTQVFPHLQTHQQRQTARANGRIHDGTDCCFTKHGEEYMRFCDRGCADRYIQSHPIH